MKQATHFQVHKGWKLLMMDIGLNPAHVLRLAGLPEDLFSRKGATLTPSEYFNLFSGIEECAGSEELPLKIGAAISAEVFDPPVFACLCSPDLNTALKRLSAYKRLIGPMVLDVTITPQQTEVGITCYGHVGEMPRSLAATELVFFTQLARLATRTRVVPIHLEVPQLPRQKDPYHQWFGASLTKGNNTRIVFSARDASLPFLTEDAAMWDFFEEGLKKRLSDLDTQTTVSQRVKSALLELLPGGQSSIDDVAQRLAMSKRSLQRYLGRESSGYQEILNTTRKELAHHYLMRSDISQAEISFLLGFNDSNSFLRAFKGWTGATPGEYRNAVPG